MKIITSAFVHSRYIASIAFGLSLVALVNTAIAQNFPNHFDWAQVSGYAGILLSLGLVWFALQYYLAMPNSHAVGFFKRLLFCQAVISSATVLYGFWLVVQFSWITPEFLPQALAHYQQEMSPSERSALNDQKGLLLSPLFQALVMMVTVWLLGLPVSGLCAALSLRNKRPAMQQGIDP